MVKVEVTGVPLEYGLESLRDIFSLNGTIPLINVYRVNRNGTVYVIYGNTVDVQGLVIDRLNGTRIGGSPVDIHVFRRRQPTRQKQKQEQKQKQKQQQQQQQEQQVDRTQGRIILRNLPYTITSVKQLVDGLLQGDARAAINQRASTVGKGFAFLQCNSAAQANDVIERHNGSTVLGRCIAIDHAINKEQFVKQRASRTQTEPPEDEQSSDSSEASDDSHDSNSSHESSEEESPATFDRAAEASRKLFIRNVPFEMDAEQLADVFREEMGDEIVDRALIVKDRYTGISKGTAFLICVNEDAAQHILQYSSDIKASGRRLIIDRSLMPAELKSVVSARKDKGDPKDSRHLELAWVGRIDEHSDIWSSLPDRDQQKRLRAIGEKKQKLNNTNYHVSTVRLSVRNLPTSVDEKKLKSLYPPARNRVKQAKIVVDAVTGKSRGFGFLQYLKHKDALAALKHINNNPSLFGTQKRPIVEFALDDQRKLHMVQKRNVAIKAHVEKRKREGWVSKKQQHNAMLREEDEEQKLISEHYVSTKKPKQKQKSKTRRRQTVEEQWSSKQDNKKKRVQSSAAPSKKWYE